MSARVSLVIASRDRPSELARCLTAVSQLRHRTFEVIVAADRAGLEAARSHATGSRLRLVPVEGPGVGRARNAGLAVSAGDFVAFIDDDAVPEPTWLCRLSAPFRDPGVGASTGFVLGRNGITLQWGAREVTSEGAICPMSEPPTQARSFAGDAARAVMTEGTNMAFRRELLVRIGGFDSAYLFGFDDADIALRVAVSGAKTAIVPDAVVHHAFAASTRRRSDRAPRDLQELGQGTAVFLRRHSRRDIGEALAVCRRRVRAGVIRAMVDGRIEPCEAARLLTGYDRGVERGLGMRLETPSIHGLCEVFRPFRSEKELPPAPRIVAGFAWRSASLGRAAAALRGAGHAVTVFRFSPTSLFHRVRFTPEGTWLHTGGIFGRSDRSGPLLKWVGFRRRVLEEAARVAPFRGIDHNLIEPSDDGPTAAVAARGRTWGRTSASAG